MRHVRSFSVVLLLVVTSVTGLAGAASPPDPDCSATPSSVETLHGVLVGNFISCAPTADGATTVTYEITKAPSNGTFNFDPSGAFEWTPPKSFAGNDSLEYKATDDAATPHVTTGSIILTSTNEAPSCSPVDVNVHAGDVSQNNYFNCFDPDFEPVTYAVTGVGPAHGDVTDITAEGAFTYTPDAGYAGPDSFTYAASDGAATSPDATVTIGVNNEPPECFGVSDRTTKANTPLDLFISCSDDDFSDNPVTPQVVSGQGPAHGTVSAYDDDANKFTYTPASGYVGTDSFKISVTDGTATATYTQNVEVTNVKPECYEQDTTIRIGKPATISFYCYDQDNDAITVTANQAVNGTVGAVTEGEFDSYSVVFTPTAVGPASFMVSANDGVAGGDAVKISLEVTVNHAPNCFGDVDGAVHTRVDANLVLPLSCTDPDQQDQDLDYTIQTHPPAAAGTVTLTEGASFWTATFDPAAGFTGFTDGAVRVSDGELSTVISRRIHVSNTPLCSPAPTLQVRPGASKSVQPHCTFPSDMSQEGASYVITDSPDKGTLSPSGGAAFNNPRLYTAFAGTSGADSYSMKVTSPAGDSPVVVQPINITPTANEAPDCFDFGGYTQDVFNDRDNTVNLEFMCDDPDGDALTPVKDSNPAHGTLVVSGADLIYQPTSGYTGPDSFTFHVLDSMGAASQTVTFQVEVKVPEKPTCEAIPTILVRPTKSKTVFLDCSSPQDDPQTYSVAEQPAAGTGTVEQVGSAGSEDFKFTATSTTGTTSFKLKATNKIGASELLTVQVNVSPTANEAPFCFGNSGVPQTVPKEATTPLDLVEQCEDPDGDPLKFVRVTQPLSLGTVTPEGPANVLSFVAGATTGTTSFTYKAVDDQPTPLSSNVATYTVTVAASLAPTCTPQPTLDIRPGQTKGVFMLCSSPVGSPLTYEIVTQPLAGTLSGGTGSSRTYTAPGTAGPQSFTYRAVATNGGPSTEYIQSINVSADANEKPSCFSNGTGDRQTVAGGRATVLTTDDECHDADNDPLTFAIAGQPLHGTATVVDGKIRYTPAVNYIGFDQLSFTASDGHGGTSDPKTWYVDVVAPTPPSCVNGPALSIRPNQTRSVELLCTDPTGEVLTYDIGTQPTKGTLDPSGPSTDEFRDYTAGAAEGADSFTYSATSLNGTSALVTRSINITASANVAPECYSNSGFPIVAATAVQKTLDPDCEDEDGDALSYTKVGDPLHGTVTDAGGVLKYTSAAGYTGADQFTYSASDGHGGTSQVRTLYLNVVTPTGPTCTTPTTQTVRPGKSIPVYLFCSDVTGAPVTLEVTDQPDHGTLNPASDATLAYRTYTANANAPTGNDSFSYRATSVNGTSPTVVQTIAINPAANHAPGCEDDEVAVTAQSGVAKTVEPGCSDIDGDALTPVKQSDPAHGTVTVTDGVLKYTSTGGYTGPDSFTFRMTDGLGGQSTLITAFVTVVAGAVNAAPACQNVSGVQVKNHTPKAITLLCTDADGTTLTLSVVEAPAHGQVTFNGGNATYTPTGNYAGSDSFTYRASDGTAFSQTAHVDVTVAANQAPECPATTTVEVAHNTAKSIAVACTDAEGDAVTLTNVSAPEHGTLSAISGPSVTFTPATGYAGGDGFTYQAADGHGGVSGAKAVVLTVAAAPVVDPKPTVPATPSVTPTPTPGPGTGGGNAQEESQLRDAADSLLNKGRSNAGKLDPKKPTLNLGNASCPQGCDGGVTIQTPPNGLLARAAAAKSIGKATFSVPPGGSKAIKVKINAAGKKLLKKSKKGVKVKVTVALKSPSGATSTQSKTMTLKLKKKRR